MIAHGHRFTEVLDYSLPQVRGFLTAIAVQEAAREARRLSMMALATRGNARDLEKTLDRLDEAARGLKSQ